MDIELIRRSIQAMESLPQDDLRYGPVAKAEILRQLRFLEEFELRTLSRRRKWDLQYIDLAFLAVREIEALNPEIAEMLVGVQRSVERERGWIRRFLGI